ncbi:Secretin GspD [Vibrio stylophorae]|uniref:Secretin GspD n=1 Tax=Vibrio stylophorae TaxID=659351 RepID=A0ABN8DML8_9VIBR|nr:type II secretion system secretin GspD [Vibrio stylophorae]CAH0532336.1 Secretin GspD [Vibrio stylophorae]
MLASALVCASPAYASEEYSASFKDTDIHEFINIVGRNLKKTIIVDPSVRGQIDVRSYDLLNEEQYYRFFLNVLEVHGFAAVEMDNGVIKIVKDKDAKTSAVPVVDSLKGQPNDAIVTRVIAVRNVSVRELSPLLRQLNDNAGAGNVVHYDPANVIMITGRAAVVARLADIIERVDRAGDKEITVVELRNASASEMVRIVDALNKSDQAKNVPSFLQPKLVADERTNSILVSGDPAVRQRLVKLIRQLDKEMATSGNHRVIYLKYAKAEDLVDVLKGVSDNIISGKSGGAKEAAPMTSKDSVTIAAHPDTNALVITAPPDVMRSLEDVISQLDIRRAQVLVEAMIVEMTEGDGISLGVQWGSLEDGGVIQFGNTGLPVSAYAGALEASKDKVTETVTTDRDTGAVTGKVTTTEEGDLTALATAMSGLNGGFMGLVMGDWTMLVNAIQSDANSNILSSPSITVMDNDEASFIVGEEVPVVTGSTSSSNNDNPFQTVERKEVGIKLKVTPQINEGDSVQLKIEQEVSSVLNASGAVDVRFAKRQLNTTVLVKDGQMLVLGGLIDEQVVESDDKVPVLGDIPLLGTLFSSKSNQKTKRNLMVFIKPTIIRDITTADGVTQRKYNYIRAEQLYRQQEGISLMPNTETPLLPEYHEDMQALPELRVFAEQARASQ